MTSPGRSRVTKTSEEQRSRGAPLVNSIPDRVRESLPPVASSCWGAPWPSRAPRVSAQRGGTLGGVSLKQGTRATQKTESPRRGPGEGARRRARGTVRGGRSWLGWGSPWPSKGPRQGLPRGGGTIEGGPRVPQRQENPSPDAGEGGKANKCGGGMPPRRATGEGSVKPAIDPGEGRLPGSLCPGAGARSGWAGWGSGEAERWRRHNISSAMHTGPTADFSTAFLLR
jgi:hypothetical protein